MWWREREAAHLPAKNPGSMKSLNDGIISKETFDRFNVKRQKALAI